MLSERLLTKVMRGTTDSLLKLRPTNEGFLPLPQAGRKYMLYAHVPFCERLCPYCSFNRFPFQEDKARAYFSNLRKELLMVKSLGYDIESMYIGGGTPTILIDELCALIDLARDTFALDEVSCETNPNHLIPSYIDKLKGRVQRLSVGVQSFDDGLLKQMDRYDKYGSGAEIMERIAEATPHFVSLNADMMFNFPAQTEDILISDVEKVIASGATQTTFYPLMASPSVERSLAATVGKVDYEREQVFYEIICELLTGELPDPKFWEEMREDAASVDAVAGAGKVHGGLGDALRMLEDDALPASAAVVGSGEMLTDGLPASAAAVGDGVDRSLISPLVGEKAVQLNATVPLKQQKTLPGPFELGSAWTFNRRSSASGSGASLGSSQGEGADPMSAMIDEYVVNYEEYPAIGSGGITYLGRDLYVNTFSVADYNRDIEAGHMSLMGKTTFSEHDRMRYRFMMQLFGLRLDKRQFEADFGCTVEQGLPVEMAFMTLSGAFAINDAEQLTLTPKGRYLMVVMMRQFFIGVNNLRDQARAALPENERALLFGC